MKKQSQIYLLQFLFCVILNTVFKQHIQGQSKSKYWVDSVKSIVNKGLAADMYEIKGVKKATKYFDACVQLGMYYEQLYKTKHLNNNSKAIYYYKKISNIGRFPDEKKYFKLLALRNTVCRKLAAIYFDGDGVKKDKAYSLDLALKGGSGYPHLYKSYSEKYYGNSKILIKQNNLDTMNKELSYTFSLNPFIYTTGFTFKQIITPAFLKNIEILCNYVKEVNKNYLSIEYYCLPSIKSQTQGSNFNDYLKGYIQKKYFLSVDRIVSNVEVNDELKISFKILKLNNGNINF